MTGWRRWAYTFPPDKLEPLVKVMNAMPDALWEQWGFDGTDMMVVAVKDRRIALVLLAALDTCRLFGCEGDAAPDEYGVLVRCDQIGICEALLSGFPRSKAKWHSVVEVMIGSDAAQDAFDSAYEAVVGVH